MPATHREKNLPMAMSKTKTTDERSPNIHHSQQLNHNKIAVIARKQLPPKKPSKISCRHKKNKTHPKQTNQSKNEPKRASLAQSISLLLYHGIKTARGNFLEESIRQD
jgi:hypothetical protein